MEYFSILNLNQEPFSNSPDPEYFFRSQQHMECLQKLELSLRLRRGLNVVIGDVGTGKTTLCRQLIRSFADDKDYETHLILDPQFSSPSEFLGTVAEMFAGISSSEDRDEWQAKELIKQYLFRRGVDEKKTVVFIIDEGQKIPLFCLEILREFLNYETNEYKLLQIAIFAQREFAKTLEEHANFADRINLYHELGPMNYRDTRSMIQFRLNQASHGAKAPTFFSNLALWAIFRSTGGYPRKIINLCHRCLLTMIIQNRKKVDWFLVRSSVQRAFSIPLAKPASWGRILTAVFVGLALITLTVGLAPQSVEKLLSWSPAELKTTNIQIEPPAVNSPKAQEPEKPVSLAAVQPTGDQFLPKPISQPAIEPELAPPEDSKSQTVIEKRAEISTATPDDEPQLPLALGRVGLRRNETLWKLVEKVYGVNNAHIINSQYIKSVAEANPDIRNLNHIRIGRLIALPAIPAPVKPLHVKVWWVKLLETDRLDAAVNVIRKYPDEAPPVRIIPYWNFQLGLKFAILLKEYFYDETSAKNQLQKLPPELVAQGTILSSWDKDTVFYADPFVQL